MTRQELMDCYGSAVRDVPPDATIVEWEWPDGSGSWGWAAGPGLSEAVDCKEALHRMGVRLVWFDGELT